MEDLRIGRETLSRFGSVAFAAAAVEIVPASPARVAIIITAPTTGRPTVGDNGQVTLDSGPTFTQGAGALSLNIWDHGDIVRRPFWGIASAAGTIGFIETLFAREANGP